MLDAEHGGRCYPDAPGKIRITDEGDANGWNDLLQTTQPGGPCELAREALFKYAD
jgi:hypothetical protein